MLIHMLLLFTLQHSYGCEIALYPRVLHFVLLYVHAMYIDVVANGLYGAGFYWPSSIELRVTSHFCVFDPPLTNQYSFLIIWMCKKTKKNSLPTTLHAASWMFE